MEYTDKRSALNAKNEVIEVYFKKCSHCTEDVLVVGPCPDCNTEYDHVKTVENPETGFIHFVYACSGCPPEKRKAQKIIKIYEPPRKSTDELMKNFL